MPVVSFWSNSNKTIGQTVSAATVATNLAYDHNYKVLMMSADFKDATLENCFGAQQANKAILKTVLSGSQKVNFGTGIDGLLTMAKVNRVNPDLIKDYTKIIFSNRLEILYSSYNEEIPFETQLEYYKTIILSASKYYDYVIVDLKKGTWTSKIFDILEMSHVIVLNTEQGVDTLNDFLAIEGMQDMVKKRKVLWNICRYDKKSKYNTKNLTRAAWKRETVYSTPYNTLLYEASHESTLPDLIIKLKTARAEDENTEVVKEATKLGEGIIQRYKELQMRM